MAYWHMQLHPNDLEWRREEELLKKLSLIGLGDWKKGISQIKQFKKDMKIGDIALIRRGETPIALVEVVGDIEDNLDDDGNNLDWFRYRRKVRVLDWATDKKGRFPQLRGTLQRLVNKNTLSYKYIEDWHKTISPSFYKKQKGLKLQKIYNI